MARPTTLGTESVGKLLRQYALPSIVAMTATSLYNMADSIFIGQGVGPLALSGLTVNFPFINLSSAFGALIGTGAASLVSVKLGQKDYQSANRILGNVVTLNVIIGLAFMVISLLFLDKILYFFGATDQSLPYARDYTKVLLYGNIINHVYFGLNAVLRSSGHPRESMYATVFTVLFNVAVDPLFIFVFDWGIKGAALATVVAQSISLAWIIYIFCKKDEVVRFQRGIFKLDFKIAKSCIVIGLPPFFINAASCLMVICINGSLVRYGGDLAVASYGIFNRIRHTFVLIVLGLTRGMQPIIGYNFGARQMDRVFKTLRLATISAVIVNVVGFALCEFAPVMVAKIFTSDPELIMTVRRGMKIGISLFWLASLQMITTNFFQSIGMPKQAISVTLSRQFFFLLPFLFILPRFFGIDGVWLAIPISDVCTAILSVCVMTYHLRRFKQGKINFNI